MTLTIKTDINVIAIKNFIFKPNTMYDNKNNIPVKSPYTGASISKIITNYFRLEFEKKSE